MTAAWAVLLTALVVGWVLLDGAVQGVGATLLRERDQDSRGGQPRRPSDRRLALAAVGLLLLPGRIWFLAVCGVLLGVFPFEETDLMDMGYPVVITLIASWLLRDAGIWLRGRRPGHVWRDVWDAVLVVASILLAGSWGVLLGVTWGNGLAALGLGTVAVVVTRLHGYAVVAWRMRRTGPLPVIVTSVMIAAPVVGTAIAVWPNLVGDEGAVPDKVGITIVALVVLPVILVLQVLAWWRMSRPQGSETPVRSSTP